MAVDHQTFRLKDGGLIDRSRPLQFRFEGRQYSGFEGDTLASALLANGVRVVARSFKFHRPRGVFTADETEPCALVEVGRGTARIPSCRATTVPLTEGLEARAQGGWPSLSLDLGRILDYTHPLWPVGFYNKTFKWPGWHTWEGMIRRLSGLGRPLDGPDPDRYERVNFHCELLVCGGGPAGLAAALAAGRAGLSVVLAEQDRELGGVLLGERIEIDGRPAERWLAGVVAELDRLSNVLVLRRTTVTGIHDHRVTTLSQAGDGSGWRECYWTLRPKQILFACGAIEQGLVFPHNDRPGIMLAGAVREYLNRYAVVPGNRIIVATNNDSAYQAAIDLVDADLDVMTVIDSRTEVSPGLVQAMADEGIAHLAGARITDTRGDKGVSGIQVEEANGEAAWHDCELLAVSGGWNPRTQLIRQAGGKLKFDAGSCSYLPAELPPGIHVAGACGGAADLTNTFKQGVRGAQAACKALGRAAAQVDVPRVNRDILGAGPTAWTPHRPSRHRQWLDLAHDVTTADAELAVREGFVSVEHFKRYTTAGMAVDQGKTSSANVFQTVSALTGRHPDETGATTPRPPYTPVTVGALAAQGTGELFHPRRYLPAHTVHAALGARFEDYGWQRPDAYPLAGETLEQATRREALAVRTAVGVFDNSPIGKIEVRGPDAARFLDRLYINDVLSLKPGRARYGFMLNDNGVIIDDGVFVRLAEDHFLLHSTSAHASRVCEHMEEWLQCEWTDLDVMVHDGTAQSANFAIAGPRARDTLNSLGCGAAVSAEALPHMAVTQAAVGGIDARIARVSYSGELGFEVTVPARYGASLLRVILDAGQAHGIVPYGVEALMVLRCEKGFLHVGTDTDGSSTPDDVGWGAVARRKERDYIGRRSLFRSANVAAGRRQLVGLEVENSAQPLRPGAHLLLGEGRQPPAPTDGWVTSSCYSPNLERPIALALLRDGREHTGEAVTVCDEAARFPARVVAACFLDPDNRRLS